MKKVIIILLLVLAVFWLYNRFIAEPKRVAAEAAENISEAALRARQNEARLMLRQAFQKQESFHARTGHYTYKLDSLRVEERGTYYRLEIKRAKTNNFEIRAEGNIDSDGYYDVWVITEDGKPYNIVDDVKKN